MALLPGLIVLAQSEDLNSATLSQVIILLAAAQRPYLLGELATLLDAPPPRVSRSIDVLEDRGLVETELNPADRRQSFVRATHKGVALARRGERNV